MNFAGVDFFNGPVNLSVPASVSFWIASMSSADKRLVNSPAFFGPVPASSITRLRSWIQMFQKFPLWKVPSDEISITAD